MILLILGAMWAGVGISWLRSRTGQRGTNSISAFSNHLTVLARTSPARSGLAVVDGGGRSPQARSVPYGSPNRMSRRQVHKRRRDVLLSLAGGTSVSLLLALVVGGIFVATTVVGLALTGAYVALLVRMQKMAAERQAKVRYLPQVHESDAVDERPVLVLQRSAN